MNVKCIEKTAANWMDQLRDVGYTSQSILDLSVNKSYLVYGMCVNRSALFYLLESDSFYPTWFPSVLFEVTDGAVSKDWHFNFLGHNPENLVTAIWGYRELVYEEGYFDALSQGDETAVSVFRAVTKVNPTSHQVSEQSRGKRSE